MSSGVILLKRPYISFSSPLLLILRREITVAAVALFLNWNLFDKLIMFNYFCNLKKTQNFDSLTLIHTLTADYARAFI